VREPDFIPRWYPRLRARRHMLIVEIWCIALLGGALYLWAWQSRMHIQQQRSDVAALDSKLGSTSIQLEKLKAMLDQQRKLKEQAQVVDRLGPYVPAARLIDVLNEAMPPSMALLDLQQETQETPLTKAPGDAAATASPASGSAGPGVDRKVKLTVTAVAPSDADLANFMTKLSAEPNLADVSMAYARDRTENGHAMREFAVTFDIDLGIRTQ
jgi:Tfp pilus assembly protein PilN